MYTIIIIVIDLHIVYSYPHTPRKIFPQATHSPPFSAKQLPKLVIYL